MKFVDGAYYADQHLTKDGGKTTLCGVDRDDIRADIPFLDYLHGFDKSIKLACKRCNDVAARIKKYGWTAAR